MRGTTIGVSLGATLLALATTAGACGSSGGNVTQMPYPESQSYILASGSQSFTYECPNGDLLTSYGFRDEHGVTEVHETSITLVSITFEVTAGSSSSFPSITLQVICSPH